MTPPPQSAAIRDLVVVASPFEEPHARVVSAAARAGALGLLDLGRDPDAARQAFDELARWLGRGAGASGGGGGGLVGSGGSGSGRYGVRVPAGCPIGPDGLPPQVDTVLLADPARHTPDQVAAWARAAGRPRIWAEVTSPQEAAAAVAAGAEALVARGHEAGGRVGGTTSFVLLQQLLGDSGPGVPVRVCGGIGPHTAAAAVAGGAAGVLLDAQLALTAEVEEALPAEVAAVLRAMDGSETRLADGHRVFTRPDLSPPEGPVPALLGARSLRAQLLPVGQDGASAARLAARHRTTGGVVQAVRAAVTGHLEAAVRARPLERPYPVAQGPMTRVSDQAAFAEAVAAAGGLPYLALAVMEGPDVRALLAGTAARLGDRPWGVGLLGFAPEALRREQLAAVAAARPPYAIIAGGTPAQAAPLEAAGIRTHLHVPSPGLLERYLAEGARRFVFEGLECGGHVGPRASFPLWEEQIELLLSCPEPRELDVLFAGGIHDERSAAMAVAAAAPLAARGARVGVLMGTAYLFTREAVDCGAVLPVFQRTAVECAETVLLHTAPGHATRCAPTPYTGAFEAVRQRLTADGTEPRTVWEELERLNLGRLRLAAKGLRRRTGEPGGAGPEEARPESAGAEDARPESAGAEDARPESAGSGSAGVAGPGGIGGAEGAGAEAGAGPGGARPGSGSGRLPVAGPGGGALPAGVTGPAGADRRLEAVDEEQQYAEGLFMLGQAAALRSATTTVAELHAQVTEGATRFLERRARELLGPQEREAAGAAAGPLEVAIVGMACAYPGSPDLAAYWARILDGTDAVTEVPAERWDPALYYDPDPARAGERTPSRWGGFLGPVPFDALAHGIPPASLAGIEPVQLLALEISARALADAGYDKAREFDRSRTAVVFGAEAGTELAGAYGLRALLPSYLGAVPAGLDGQLPRLTEDSFPGVLANVIAGRVANRLDLGGANCTVDAACASSLAALDLACRQLRDGDADMVLCGGADLHNGINDYLMFSSVRALSPGGRCRPFDTAADGIALGEGVGVLVLKRLADAERAGDRVYAVVKAVGSASDGRSLGLTAPRPEGQRRALERAYARAGISPGEVGLVEAHGTGTVVGDSTELTVLTELFTEAGAAPGSCALGSVKSQIGHTKCAAGLAGLIKAARAVHAGVRPPTLHVEAPNPAWREADSPFFFDAQARPWAVPAGRRIAGVSAFGFGGTNYHAVLAGYEGAPEPAHGLEEWPAELFCFRGEDRRAAGRVMARLAARLEENDAAGRPWALRDLAAEAAASGTGPVRVAVVAGDLTELAARLERARAFAPGAGVHVREEGAAAEAAEPGGVAFLFPGQGSQRPGMLGELFTAFPALRGLLDEAPADVVRAVFPPASFGAEGRAARRAAVTDTRVAQPALGLAGAAAHLLLGRLGVRPDAVAGHSYGELTALWAAGVYGMPELLRLSVRRAEAILAAAGADPGTMAAVSAAPEEVRGIAERAGCVVANHNAPRQCVVSGPAAAVERVVSALREAGLSAQPIPVACAFHSEVVAGAAGALAAELAGTELGGAVVPVWSNTTAAPYPADADGVRALLARQVAEPVRFVEQVEAMYAAGVRTFVEAGPGRVLCGLVGRILEGRPHTVVPLDVPGEHGLVRLVTALAELVAAGVPVDPEALFRGRTRRLPERAPNRPGWLVDGHLVRTAAGAPVPGGLHPARRLPLPTPVPATAPGGPSPHPPGPWTAPGGTATRPAEPWTAPGGTAAYPSNPWTVPDGSTDHPAPPWATPGGTASHPSAPWTAPGGTTDHPAPPWATPGGTTAHPSDPWATPGGTTDRPADPSNTPGGTMDHPTQPRPTPGGEAAHPSDPWNTPGGTTDRPAEPWTTPGVTARRPAEPWTTPGGPVPHPSAPWTTPGGTTDHPTQPWTTPGGTAAHPSNPWATPGRTAAHPAESGMTPDGAAAYPAGPWTAPPGADSAGHWTTVNGSGVPVADRRAAAEGVEGHSPDPRTPLPATGVPAMGERMAPHGVTGYPPDFGKALNGAALLFAGSPSAPAWAEPQPPGVRDAPAWAAVDPSGLPTAPHWAGGPSAGPRDAAVLEYLRGARELIAAQREVLVGYLGAGAFPAGQAGAAWRGEPPVAASGTARAPSAADQTAWAQAASAAAPPDAGGMRMPVPVTEAGAQAAAGPWAAAAEPAAGWGPDGGTPTGPLPWTPPAGSGTGWIPVPAVEAGAWSAVADPAVGWTPTGPGDGWTPAAGAGGAAAPAPWAAPAASADGAGPDLPPGGAGSGGAGPRTAEEVMEVVLEIVQTRTGYPPDMLDPGLDLEADLSIDSIKRVEIIGALADRIGLPRDTGGSEGTAVEALSRIKTLRGIVDWVVAHAGGTEPGRSPEPGAAAFPLPTPTPTPTPSPDPWYAPAADPGPGPGPAGTAPPPDGTQPPAPAGVSVAGTDSPTAGDSAGGTAAVPAQAPAAGQGAAAWDGGPPGGAVRPGPVRGVEGVPDPGVRRGPGAVVRLRVDLVPVEAADGDPGRLRGLRVGVVGDGQGVADALAGVLREHGAEAGVLGAAEGGWDGIVDLSGLRGGTEPVLPGAFAGLRRALVGGAGRLVLAGVPGAAGAGLHGFARSAALEFPGTLVRAVEVHPKEEPGRIAAHLLAELGGVPGDGGPVSVGYALDGTRFVRRPVPAPLYAAGEPAAPLGPDSVVLLTGGARGITARTALALARATGCHVELLGRTPQPPPVPEEFGQARDRVALRAALIASGLRTPAEIEAAASRILAEREVRATLAALAGVAASVRYHRADVTDEDAVRAVVADVRARHGRLDGLVHGAGLLRDGLLRDKRPEDFAGVFAAKVAGARHLAAAAADHGDGPAPRFLALFGSVAGVYGNRGQSDYGAANDALDCLAHTWARSFPGRVLAVDWGPWAAESGGMVTPELARAYAGRGIPLIDPDAGTAAFLAELAHGSDVQVVLMAAAPVPAAGGGDE
ncbi:SDR family NAD(P)-dependent oxidoreductase [Streptomyces sp. NPDC001594]|uniref:SDR family NAD(P)-dependent oxidoreductase n=1 Tax=Streptomyces sp. NPDC001594 TaxID=3364590 RepID=UPI0036AC1A3E